MIDTHTHLQFDNYRDDRLDVLRRMQVAGVDEALVVGVDEASSQAAVDLASQYTYLFATAGLHPTDIPDDCNDAFKEIEQLARGKKIVAIGEVGLDYKYLQPGEEISQKRLQHQILERFIDMANRYALPVIFHVRMAEADFLNVVATHQLKKGGVVHCFSSSWEVAKKLLDHRLMLSFTNMITYPKNDYLREVIQQIPHDRVMLETDSPFLPPEKLRGKRNEPAYLGAAASVLAEQWHTSLAYVDQTTTATARAFFGI